MLREHHRQVAYRPPRERPSNEGGDLSVLLRFVKRYVLPYRRKVLVGILLVTLNSCSFYLMAYYMRIVVDDVLVVTERGRRVPDAESPVRPLVERDRKPATRRGVPHGAVAEATRNGEADVRPPGAMRRLMGLFALYVTTILLLNFSARKAQRSRIDISQLITRDIREDLHHKILSLSRNYHERHTPGQLMARILSDVKIVQNQMMTTLLDASSQVLMFLVGATLLLSAEWRLAIPVFACIPPYVFIYRRALSKIKRVNREMRHTNACLYGLVSQKLDAVRAILAYGREPHEHLNFHRLSSCFLRDSLMQQRLNAGLARATFIISSATTATIFLLGTGFVLRGDMTLGRMMYTYGVAAALFVPVQGLSRLSVIVSRLVVIIQRLLHTLDEPEEIEDAPGAVPFPKPLRSDLTLRNVYFSYGSEPEPILKDVSLKIPVGRWICLMGPSGCGKTTLLHLLDRLYDPTSGDISADGTSLDRIALSSLRRRMAIVPQEPQIFSGTVRDNIAYGAPDATEERIMEVAQDAECHDFIMKLPVKYETTIGEKGQTLSGGQRQRLSIARALMTQPQVLLLDDCTSALDADTERRLQETLSRLLVGKTAVIVSQRVSMAMRCHKICVLINGIISEQGSHQELVQAGGYYAHLYAQQTG